MKKNKKKLSILVLGTVLGMSVVPTYANAGVSLDDAKGSLRTNTQKTRGYFTSEDLNRKDYYSNLNGNKLYLREYEGIYSYTNLPPSLNPTDRGASLAATYENNKLKTAYFNAGASKVKEGMKLLVTRDRGSDLYNENFKVKKKKEEYVNTSYKQLETSDYSDINGRFKDYSGEWRYMGYGTDGSIVGNAYFPDDYFSNKRLVDFSYVYKPWNQPVGSVARIFTPGTGFDEADPKSSEYKDKAYMVNRLLEQEPAMKRKGKTVYWMNRLSLMGQPTVGSGMFRASLTNNRYTEAVVRNAEKPKNLKVTSITVKDQKGTVMGKFYRSAFGKANGKSYKNKPLIAGQKYDFEVEVTNESKYATKLKPSLIDFGYKKNYSSDVDYPTDFKTGANANEYNKKLSGAKIGANATVKYNLDDLTIPTNAVASGETKSKIRFSSLIDARHQEAGDNLDPIDDAGELVMDVKKEPIKVTYIDTQLIDKDGKEAENPIPGEKYKVRYTYRVTGQYKEYYQVVDESAHYDKDGKWVPTSYRWESSYEPVKFTLLSDLYQKLPNDRSAQRINEPLSTTVYLTGGSKTLEFTTPEYKYYEFPWIKSVGNLVADKSGQFQMDSSNKTKTWHEDYDLSIKNVQVIPRTERVGVEASKRVAVSFDIFNKVPETAEDADYETDVPVNVQLFDKSGDLISDVTTLEHLESGSNNRIIRSYSVPAKTGEWVKAIVTMNKNYQTYESSIYDRPTPNIDNNTGSAMTANAGALGLLGNNNGTSNNTAYFAPMITPDTKAWVTNPSNSWKQSYVTHNWEGKTIPYTTLSGGSESFALYNGLTTETKKLNQTEEYSIESVLFRSKYTKDNKLGDVEYNKDGETGWVRLDGDKPEDAKIKAGYGYELKVRVAYETDAFEVEPDVAVKGTNGSNIRPKHVEANLVNDLFLRVKGSKKIYSVNPQKVYTDGGSVDTIPNLQGKVISSDKNKTVYEYTIKPQSNLGLQEVGKMFVKDTTKDGKYGLEIWTPVINGIATKRETSSSYIQKPLADAEMDMTFEVKGSATDDLIDSVIQ